MEIKQFEDKNLAHYSYAIVSKGEVALIDPARNPQPYYDFAKQNNATISTVIETHPHADFVSSHLEIHKTTGAIIYVSKLLGAEYAHQIFDEGNKISLGNITLSALNTPGHSPDSISIVAIDENGKYFGIKGWPANNSFTKSSSLIFCKLQLAIFSAPMVLVFATLKTLPHKLPAP